MKRDIDLARQLLLDIENRGVDCAVSVLRSGSNPEAEDRIRYHLRLLIDAGLLKEVDRTSTGVPCVRLTYEGHELLELIRSENRWREAKWACQECTGGLSLLVIRGLLVRWAVGGQTPAYVPRRRYRRHYVPVNVSETESRRPRYAFRADGYRVDPYYGSEAHRFEPASAAEGVDWRHDEASPYVRFHPEWRERWGHNGAGIDLDGDGIADLEVDSVLPDYLI